MHAYNKVDKGDYEQISPLFSGKREKMIPLRRQNIAAQHNKAPGPAVRNIGHTVKKSPGDREQHDQNAEKNQYFH